MLPRTMSRTTKLHLEQIDAATTSHAAASDAYRMMRDNAQLNKVAGRVSADVNQKIIYLR